MFRVNDISVVLSTLRFSRLCIMPYINYNLLLYTTQNDTAMCTIHTIHKASSIGAVNIN